MRQTILFHTSDGTLDSTCFCALAPDLINSNAGAAILKITYGWTVTSNEDPLVSRMKQALRLTKEMVQPGKWLVEIFPLLRFVPAWMPGVGFKHKAIKARHHIAGMEYVPFKWAKEQIVRDSRSDHNLFVTDSLGVSLPIRKLVITLSCSLQWVSILMAVDHSIRKKKIISCGVVMRCTQVAPTL